MPWYLDRIGGRRANCPEFEFGPDQDLPRNISSNLVVPSEEKWPIVIHQVNEVKNDLDFTIGPFTGVLLVSVAFKRLVEEFEPETHHFVPVDLHLPDGSEDRTDHFIFKPGNVLDQSIVVAESDLAESTFKGVVERYGATSQTPRITWKESAVAGKHVWIDRLFRSGLTVSDALYAEAKRRDLAGWLAIEGASKARLEFKKS